MNGMIGNKYSHILFDSRGAVALTTVIIMSALLLLIGLSASRIGQTEIIIAGQMDRGQHARTLAITCMEEAMHRLKLDQSYSGGTVDIDGNPCSVSLSGSGDSRTIEVSASSGDHSKNIRVQSSRRHNNDDDAEAWNIDSWQELDP